MLGASFANTNLSSSGVVVDFEISGIDGDVSNLGSLIMLVKFKSEIRFINAPRLAQNQSAGQLEI